MFGPTFELHGTSPDSSVCKQIAPWERLPGGVFEAVFPVLTLRYDPNTGQGQGVQFALHRTPDGTVIDPRHASVLLEVALINECGYAATGPGVMLDELRAVRPSSLFMRAAVLHIVLDERLRLGKTQYDRPNLLLEAKRCDRYIGRWQPGGTDGELVCPFAHRTLVFRDGQITSADRDADAGMVVDECKSDVSKAYVLQRSTSSGHWLMLPLPLVAQSPAAHQAPSSGDVMELVELSDNRGVYDRYARPYAASDAGTDTLGLRADFDEGHRVSLTGKKGGKRHYVRVTLGQGDYGNGAIKYDGAVCTSYPDFKTWSRFERASSHETMITGNGCTPTQVAIVAFPV